MVLDIRNICRLPLNELFLFLRDCKWSRYGRFTKQCPKRTRIIFDIFSTGAPKCSGLNYSKIVVL